MTQRTAGVIFCLNSALYEVLRVWQLHPREYFAAGSRLAWVVEPKSQTVRAHTAPDEFVVLGVDEYLDGGNVLPGFRLAVRELFESDD